MAIKLLWISLSLVFHFSFCFQNTNIKETERYLSCPFHALHNHEFACHEVAMERTETILSFQAPPKFNFHNPKIQNLLQNKKIALIGDSLMRNQFVSLACLLWEFDSSVEASSLVVTEQFPRIYSQLLNFDLLYMNHNSIVDGTALEILFPSKPLVIHADIEKLLHGLYGHERRPPDISLFSFGHHFSQLKYNASCTASNGCDPESLDWDRFEVVTDMVNQLLAAIARTVDTKIVWRSVPPRHFENGDWDTNGSCHSAAPCFLDLMQHIHEPTSAYYRALRTSEILRKSAELRGFGFIDVARTTNDRCDAHISNLHGRVGAAAEDCAHYCVPGVPDTWHDGLLHFLGFDSHFAVSEG